jgi:hypothetical protein
MKVDPNRWPKKATIGQWGKILDVTAQTVQARRKRGLLGDGVLTINRRRIYTREEIARAFDIQLV